MEQPHVSVLAEEAVDALNVRPGGRYIDGTTGAGGHSERILTLSSPDGRLLGLDADPDALRVAREHLARFGDRVTLVHSNFRHIAHVAEEHRFLDSDGVLFDLGLSSMQLDLWTRGFSFRRDEPLDMRFDPTAGITAAELIEELPEAELARVIWEYGEEPASRRIARALKSSREPVRTSGQLAELVAGAAGRPRGRTHPATRTFQALRIAVNEELDALTEGLRGALRVLQAVGFDLVARGPRRLTVDY